MPALRASVIVHLLDPTWLFVRDLNLRLLRRQYARTNRGSSRRWDRATTRLVMSSGFASQKQNWRGGWAGEKWDLLMNLAVNDSGHIYVARRPSGGGRPNAPPCPLLKGGSLAQHMRREERSCAGARQEKKRRSHAGAWDRGHGQRAPPPISATIRGGSGLLPGWNPPGHVCGNRC
jgi:hypothetical protein